MTSTNTDLRIRQDVLDELDWEPSVDAAHIGVSARDGVVTLTGHVESYIEKLAAERAARRVKGVKALAQEIEVNLPSAKRTSDDEIAARAVRMLEWDVAVPHDGISVTVDHGVLTLSGQVDWRYQSEEAEADARKLTGVRDVVNSIKVKPRPGSRDIHARICDALERSADLEANRISVSIEDGKVVLAGTVGAWNERMTAEDAAWAAPGVIAVDNRITIGGP
jgi:osmotically-inducible protein OsmY